MKHLITYILLAIIGISYAQESSLMICSSYKNEVARYGARIFIYDGKYCILLGDNSYETLEDLVGDVAIFLTNTFISILRVFTDGEGVMVVEDVTKEACKQHNLLCQAKDPLESDNQAFIEYSQGGSSPKDKSEYPELPSWVNLNGIRHHGQVATQQECADIKRKIEDEELEQWLDYHIRYWCVDDEGVWDQDNGVNK